MTSLVYQAYEKYLRHKRELRDEEYKQRDSYEKPTETNLGNLWPTDLGKCHRAAILRVIGTGEKFDPSTTGLDYMNTGVITEDETLEAMRHAYGDRLTDQVVLKWEMWSGKADFGIDIGGEHPVIIEHKTTSEKHFDTDSNTELPRHEHIGQAVSYMFLYDKIYGVVPEVRLFYKAWGTFAEFLLKREGKNILIESYVNGVLDIRKYEYDVYSEMEELMNWYSSGELPPRLKKKYKGCTFMGQPSCSFYNTCWED